MKYKQNKPKQLSFEPKINGSLIGVMYHCLPDCSLDTVRKIRVKMVEEHSGYNNISDVLSKTVGVFSLG